MSREYNLFIHKKWITKEVLEAGTYSDKDVDRFLADRGNTQSGEPDRHLLISTNSLEHYNECLGKLLKTRCGDLIHKEEERRQKLIDSLTDDESWEYRCGNKTLDEIVASRKSNEAR